MITNISRKNYVEVRVRKNQALTWGFGTRDELFLVYFKKNHSSYFRLISACFANFNIA